MYHKFSLKPIKKITNIGIISLFLINVFFISLSDGIMYQQYEEFSRDKRNIILSQPQSIKQLNWSETTKILASDGEANDGVGISVDIDGDYCVVGARDDDGERGSAYVFRYDGAQWVQDQKLVAADGIAGDWFGISVAIWGNYIFVGADADDNENGMNAGSVYVFRNDGASWLQQEMLVASDGTANDYFGRYISLDETHAVIGAYYDNAITGSAYVFTQIGDDWVEEEKLIASDGEPGDYFGISTAIHGDYAAVGAYRDDNDNGIDAGSVYIFKRTRDGWSQEDKILASDGASSDRFGISVALDREYMIIGAYYDEAYTGSCYIFTHTSEGWVEETKVLASDGEINDFFGRSVSLDDGYAIVGAWGDSGSSGSVYVFKQIITSWTEEAKLTASDGASNDRFGYQVALEGRNAIIGAYLDDNSNGIDAGSAYVFTREDANQPPSTPIITGPSDGTIKVAINYTFSTIDPDGDQVHYLIDWGDGTNSGWIGPYFSGEEITQAHIWSKKGDYTIKTKAKDNNGAESEWGELPVTMPYAYHLSFKQFCATLFERFPYAFLTLRYLLRC
jgi:hypothetical protein